MPIRVKTGSSTWANVTELRVKTAISTWSDVIKGRVKTAANVWSDFFTAVITPTVQSRSTISLSGGINASNNIMNDSTFVTITSTRYSWNNATGVTYVWQSSPDDSNWSDIGTAQSTTNPASGSSSSSLALTLSPSYFTSGPDMYFRFKFMATNSTYGTNASSESLSKLVSYYGTPIPQSPYPEITGSTTVGNNAFGNIGVWTNSPTSYDYRWYFMSGSTSYPLTFAQARSVSNKTLSGFSASLLTSTNHGYKVNDQLIISGMDSLFNGTHTITSRTNSTVSFTLPTPTAWSASTAYSIGSLVSFSGNAYYASISMPAPTLFSASSAYNVGDNAWDGFTRYRCIQAMSAVSAWSSSSNYPTGSIVSHNGTRWRAEQNSGMGYVIPGTSTPVGAQTPSSTNTTYWSEINVRLSSTSYWANANPNNSSYWTIQSFSGTSASGTTTAPNYYEGSSLSSQSFSLVTPTVDYRSQLNMIDKALYFAVKAYNPATLSPSEYSVYKLVYGVPVITVGTITAGSTTASIPYTHSYMTSYDIDIKYAGTSISTYPRVVTSPSTPISVSGLTAPRDYTYSITPKNGEGTSGVIKTGTFSTILEQWTITWSANGGTGGGSTTQNRGVSHTAPSPGTRDGFDFVHYRNPATGIDILYTVSDGGTFNPDSDLTFAAVWTAKTYAVTYNANGGTGAPASQTKIHGTNLTLSSTAPTRATVGSTQYTFAGWNTAANGTGTSYAAGATYTLNAPLSLFAQWTVTNLTWTITWNANGGTGGGSTTQNRGVSHTAPSPGTREGFNFSNWRNPATGFDVLYTVNDGGTFNPTGDLTFGAVWSAKTYAVTYNANGGTGAPASQTKIHGTNLTLSSTAPTRATVGSTQYTFAGWNTAANGTGTSYAAGATYTLNAALSLFAQWTETTLTWTITWNANGGTGGADTTRARGLAHTAPLVTRGGFTFSSWRHPASGDLLYSVGSQGTFTPTSSLNFFAQWTAVQPTPTVSTIRASTTGRSGSSPNFVFANPKATFNFTFTNTTSCTIYLDRSADGITWTEGVANNLAVSNNAISLSTSLPSGTTSTSGNFYYRARVNAWSGATQTGNSTGIKTSSSVRNTTTPVNNALLSFA
jgi:hypothetical protein